MPHVALCSQFCFDAVLIIGLCFFLFFQVANLWLIIIGGSLINKLDPFMKDPSSIVDLLGVSVPGKAQVT